MQTDYTKRVFLHNDSTKAVQAKSMASDVNYTHEVLNIMRFSNLGHLFIPSCVRNKVA